ncbi:MAG: glycosyltransferase family 2 protein [Blastocatellia bacterium]
MKALHPTVPINNLQRTAADRGAGAAVREAAVPDFLRAQAVPAPERPFVSVIIPALNEEESIGAVLAAIPRAWVNDVIVVDNGSADRTERIARQYGARVVSQPERGYGAACLAGIAALEPETEIVVFLDADFSDYPEDIGLLIRPLIEWGADLALGARTLDGASRAALTPQQRWGNWLATTLIRWRFGFRYTDLGPFRAIRREALESLGMRDRNYGWTVEMQIKALQAGLRIVEVPLRYRVRIGQSKISGTVKGTLLAGVKILYTIGKYALLK